MIIGLTGQAQHGKDTVGAYLVEQYGFRRYAFADALKSMALTLDPIIQPVSEQSYAPKRLSTMVENGGWEESKKNPEVRRFLQVLGTEAVRDHLGEQSWVQALQNQLVKDGQMDDFLGFGGIELSKDARVVITDVRFPNEADWVARYGMILKVVRPNYDNGMDLSHPSEAFVSTLTPNAVVINDGSFADLYDQVEKAMANAMVRW